MLHDFVVMPNHVHLLLTVDETSSVERAMQLVKGGFSYRLRKEHGYPGEVWQRGFSEVRIYDNTSFEKHRDYIAYNPVHAGLVASPDMFPFTLTSLTRKKQGLKPALHTPERHG
ncbi:hypothetical protein GCM10011586_17460 [Silvibacterium dinghuense]|nr:hypothetical protein GCM10011586_17460 [Silvibacterium dinghuense]